ncbi:MAG TPA: hypothetical protein DCW83_05195, partial [Saprospirales bacterium]|nr:hypothetical protein [Saprospirales bacterium]
WNSTYPYVVGPTFYGVKENRKVDTVTEDTEVYDATVTVSDLEFQQLEINIYPNPTVDLIAIQITGLISDDYKIDLIDMNGKLVATTRITIGSTLAYFDVETLYSGNYMIVISNGSNVRSEKVVIGK